MGKIIFNSVMVFIVMTFALGTATLFTSQDAEAKRIGYIGHKNKRGCTKCHKKQTKSWVKTRHGQAMESLKPGVMAKEKKAAKLDPDKDYTKDKDCLGCHTTGYKKGGYIIGNNKKMASFSNVGCESCHGPGKGYMKVKNKYPDDNWPRKSVIKAGMKYGEKKQCVKCHNSDSPFNAEVDKKYDFKFKKEILKKGTHKHFKLKNFPPRKNREFLYE